MDETIEKKVIEEASDFSIFSMFLQADIVVKIVIIILIFSSVWSWAIIFSKYTSLKNILIDSEDFEENFYSSETLSKLSKRLGSQPTHPMESVFFSAMVYFEKLKLAFLIKMTILSKSFVIMLKRKWKLSLIRNFQHWRKVSIFLHLLALQRPSSAFLEQYGVL